MMATSTPSLQTRATSTNDVATTQSPPLTARSIVIDFLPVFSHESNPYHSISGYETNLTLVAFSIVEQIYDPVFTTSACTHMRHIHSEFALLYDIQMSSSSTIQNEYSMSANDQDIINAMIQCYLDYFSVSSSSYRHVSIPYAATATAIPEEDDNNDNRDHGGNNIKNNNHNTNHVFQNPMEFTIGMQRKSLLSQRMSTAASAASQKRSLLHIFPLRVKEYQPIVDVESVPLTVDWICAELEQRFSHTVTQAMDDWNLIDHEHHYHVNNNTATAAAATDYTCASQLDIETMIHKMIKAIKLHHQISTVSSNMTTTTDITPSLSCYFGIHSHTFAFKMMTGYLFSTIERYFENMTNPVTHSIESLNACSQRIKQCVIRHQDDFLRTWKKRDDLYTMIMSSEGRKEITMNCFLFGLDQFTNHIFNVHAKRMDMDLTFLRNRSFLRLNSFAVAHLLNTYSRCYETSSYEIAMLDVRDSCHLAFPRPLMCIFQISDASIANGFVPYIDQGLVVFPHHHNHFLNENGVGNSGNGSEQQHTTYQNQNHQINKNDIVFIGTRWQIILDIIYCSTINSSFFYGYNGPISKINLNTFILLLNAITDRLIKCHWLVPSSSSQSSSQSSSTTNVTTTTRLVPSAHLNEHDFQNMSTFVGFCAILDAHVHYTSQYFWCSTMRQYHEEQSITFVCQKYFEFSFYDRPTYSGNVTASQPQTTTVTPHTTSEEEESNRYSTRAIQYLLGYHWFLGLDFSLHSGASFQ
jgi:hypothetical protein